MTIPTPGLPPIQPTPSSGDAPKLGPEDFQQKKFSLPEQESDKKNVSETKQSPMDAAKDKPASPRWTDEELVGKMGTTRERLGQAKIRLEGQEGQKLTTDHEKALSKLTGMMDKDLRSIAQKTNGAYAPPEKKGSPLEQLTTWLDSAHSTMSQALAFKPTTGKDGNIEPGQFLALQYSVQRASQKVELFNSVIGSTVSGIKTLMSTQLG